MKRKTIFIFFVWAVLAFSFPLNVYGESHEPFNNGDIVQVRGTFKRFLINSGAKMPITDRYTLSQLVTSQREVKLVNRSVLKDIPEGERLKLSPPKIKGIFDMHEHFRAGASMDQYWKVANSLGVDKAIFVPTGMNPDNAGYKEHMSALLEKQKKNPDRIIAFCTVDEADPQASEVFETCLENGGKGLKILGGHPDFYDTPLNGNVIKELFSTANLYDVPVLIHISIVRLPTAKAEFKDLMNQFPNTRVQFAHYCSTVYNGINLDQCAEFLDAYPNLYVDLSMGGGIGRYFQYMSEPGGLEKIKDFVLKYQDRVLYGSDMIVAPSGPTTKPAWVAGRMMCDFSLLQEKSYRCPVMNKGQYTLLPGFDFPKDVLQKILVDNPKRFLKIE